MASTPQPAREDFHPLEIIPFFRRIPCSRARDFIYTVIWNCLFGIAFYVMGSVSDGQLHSWPAVAFYILIANAIGYLIHVLFHIGKSIGLTVATRPLVFFRKVAHVPGLPLLG